MYAWEFGIIIKGAKKRNQILTINIDLRHKMQSNAFVNTIRRYVQIS